MSDVDKALAALEAVPHQVLTPGGSGLVHIGLLARADAGKVAKALVEAGVDLLEMRSVGTMEDVYARVTRAGQPTVPGGVR